MSLDSSQIGFLATDLSRVGERVIPFAKKALEVSARNVKDDARVVAKSASGRHAKAYPNAITYDITVGVGEIVGEIGPDLDRPQGALGFLEEGVGEQNTAGQGAMLLAERANRDDFVRGMLMAATDATGL